MRGRSYVNVHVTPRKGQPDTPEGAKRRLPDAAYSESEVAAKAEADFERRIGYRRRKPWRRGRHVKMRQLVRDAEARLEELLREMGV